MTDLSSVCADRELDYSVAAQRARDLARVSAYRHHESGGVYGSEEVVIDADGGIDV